MNAALDYGDVADVDMDALEDWFDFGIDLWTPSRIRSYVDSASSRMRFLDMRLHKGKPTLGRTEGWAVFLASWDAFYADWKRFAVEHEGWFDNLSYGVVRDVKEYEDRAAGFRRRAQKFGASTGSVVPAPDGDGDDAGGGFGPGFIFGAAAVAVGVIWLAFRGQS